MNYLDQASSQCAQGAVTIKSIFILLKADFHCKLCVNSVIIQCGNKYRKPLFSS